jgi:hypothetical protein
MRFDSAGNVGIGATPSFRLDVVDDSSANVARVSSTSTGGTRLYLRNGDATDVGDTWLYMGVNSANWSFGIDNSDSDIFKLEPYSTVGVADRFAFTAAGILGIGDTTNAKMVVGLTINQGANDDEIFALFI